MRVVYVHPHGEKKQLAKLGGRIWTGQRSKGGVTAVFHVGCKANSSAAVLFLGGLSGYLLTHRYRIDIVFTLSIACQDLQTHRQYILGQLITVYRYGI